MQDTTKKTIKKDKIEASKLPDIIPIEQPKPGNEAITQQPPQVDPVTPSKAVVAEPAVVETKTVEVVDPPKIENDQLVLTPKHLDLIKNAIAPTATPAELELFIMMARRTRLDPIMRQIYFIKYADKVSYVTSIDGYRIIAHRTGEFAGIDEPKFTMDAKGQLPITCSVTVYKLVQGVRCGFSATVKFSEYDTNKNNWAKMPETMIAKVAEAHALRKAFPNDLSGIYTQDEMDQADRAKSRGDMDQARRANTVEMITPAQINELIRLMKQKGLTSLDMKNYAERNFKKSKMVAMTKAEGSKMITDTKAIKDPDDFMDPPKGAGSDQEVSLDDIPEDLGAKTTETADRVAGSEKQPEPVVPPTAGDIKMFEVTLKKRAIQLGKPFEAMYEAYLSKMGVTGLDKLQGNLVRSVTDKIIELNSKFTPPTIDEAMGVFMPPELPKPVQEEINL